VFYQAVFQLIDTWTDTVNIEDYTNIADIVCKQVELAGAKGSWQTDDDIVISPASVPAPGTSTDMPYDAVAVAQHETKPTTDLGMCELWSQYNSWVALVILILMCSPIPRPPSTGSWCPQYS
jgi:hypothetical protein